MIVLDTSGLLAALDVNAKAHRVTREALEAARPPLLLSPLVLAELDYLVSTRVNPAAMSPVLQDIEDEVYQLVPVEPADVAVAREVMARYRELEIGLTDASLVAIAQRYQATELLTLDERHFRVVRPLSDGEFFTLLPADQPLAAP